MFDRVTVRMYEMGFGDCFLVTFWKEKIGKSVLFDCGSLSRTKAEISKVAADVVASCMGDDGKPRGVPTGALPAWPEREPDP
jgi:hypothetical protein